MFRLEVKWSLALGFIACFAVLGSARADDDEKKADAPKAKIAVFRLRGDFSESPVHESIFGTTGGRMSFRDLISRLKKAGDDSAIKAIVLVAEDQELGSAQREEVRQVMARIRDVNKKEILVHSDSLAMGDYVLFAGASRLSVVPTADLWITGMHGEAPYLRGLLNKIGVTPDFLTCGEYKSAAEIFMREGPSPAAEKMQNWLLDSIFATNVRLIAEGRHVDEAKVKDWIDGGPYVAEKAKAAGLVDAVETREAFTQLLKERFGNDLVFQHKYGEKKQTDLDFSSPFAMFKIWGDLLNEGKKKKTGKDAVGIVYVEGPISLGKGQVSPFDSETGAHSTDIRKALDEAARDDSVKAVVLRVDSPGGSAVASDIILAATLDVKAKKPFIVSMGNVAGSGGYYVTCGSNTVYADAATITGSIGVVAGKFATTPMWNKIGITFKSYQRGANAGLLSSDHPFTAEEKQRMQGWMDDIYGVFKKHVTDSRAKKLAKPIDELAGGRVYTGEQALKLGLVDKIGTLQDAIAQAASEAKISDYDVRAIPAPKNFIEKIMEESTGGKESSHEIDVTTGPTLQGGTSLMDLALPYLRQLDTRHARLVKLALERLQLLQQDGAALMMPEFSVGP
jgi:protease-4